MANKFYQIAKTLEVLPEIGKTCAKWIRKFKLGKFRYDIYYRENEKTVDILGIWHTSRGTRFNEPATETYE